MRYSHVQDILTSPAASLNEAFCHISYALFRTDEDFGRVIAARFPAGSVLSVGDILHRRLDLSDQAVSYLVRQGDRDTPLFCLSSAGLGLLCKKYDAVAGLGLYLHIHCRPDSGARLLCAGALGSPSDTSFYLSRKIRDMDAPLRARDDPSFPALLDAWRCVQNGLYGLGSPDPLCECPRTYPCDRTREEAVYTPEEIAAHIERLSGFAGCRVLSRVAEGAERVTVSLYRPLLLDAMLLYLLTEVRTHAATRQATVTVGAVANPRGRVERRLRLTVEYPIDTLHMPLRVQEGLRAARRYLSDAADLGGLDLGFPPLLYPDLRRPAPRPASTLQEQLITLEWLSDPALLPSGDLKARNELR